ncbi:hypothetical protein N7471_006732 [Penicillium samsonianum]|uniref:uncharacterized protein n=1 Tax=Penicillium samsonianum TaxID=1882272 RepID=UPI002548F73C|nr:uncharacterized protein N7471_006732 [Penicillium samsonianum]KAJ6140246.1 hypothetical protein N7471_006732 [Penicillium samsonianum]
MKSLLSWVHWAADFVRNPHQASPYTLELGEISPPPASDVVLRSKDGDQYRNQVVILISCLTLTMTGCGLGFAFGVYQELYETIDGPFQGASPAAIDLIGTLSASLMTLGAPIASIGLKKYGPRPVILFGGALFAISGIAASFGTHLWHFQLSQGVLQGCAACLTYIPAVTVSPRYFRERRALALGIITSGTGFGGMIWAPFLRYLISTIGFRHTLRAVGAIASVMTVLSASVLKDAVSTESARAANDIQIDQPAYIRSKNPATKGTLIRSPKFIAHASGTALQAAAYMIPMYFMSSYARTLGYTTAAGANIIALSNACNSGGKIVIGYYADRLGRLNALVCSTFISSVITYCICYVSLGPIGTDMHRVLFVVYTCMYGITAGAYVSLFPTALVEQFGLSDFSKVSGFLYMIRGMGTLFGTPLGGMLVRHGSKGGQPGLSSNFDRMFLFVAFLLCGATLSVAWARSLENKNA